MAKKILLVGINEYPGSPLNGCINDIKLMYKIFKDIYGYTDFRVLDDAIATKKNIINDLQWLCAGAKRGDELIFDYSGHGTQVPCNNKTSGWETDNMDECLVPYDMDWDAPLRDDHLNQFIKNLPKGVKILFITDCCFSGTILRNPTSDKVKNRYLPAPLHKVLTGDIDLDDELNIKSSRIKTRDPNTLWRSPFMVNSLEQGDALLISGCSDKQTSADAFINGKYHGALTYYLAQILKEANWNITYADLIKKVNAKLDQEDYEQDPQLEGKKQYFNKLFLGGIKK